jgi:methylglyoxal synthase
VNLTDIGPPTPPTAPTRRGRSIALVAHDNKKVELLRWAAFNRGTLREHDLCATGTTGTMVEYELGLPVTRFLSGPVGGDQQIGAKIADFLISSPLLANGYAGIRPGQLAG